MIDTESTMTEEEIQEKILKCLESEIGNVLMADQHRSDFETVRRKLFLTKTIARLEAKDRTTIESIQLWALKTLPPDRTDAQQKLYERLLTQFIDRQMARLQAKPQRSTIENRILAALVAAEKDPFWRQNWYFVEQYKIQFGSVTGFKADIALLLNNEPILIVECKRPGGSQKVITEGKKQLESYLHATRANLGILANNTNPKKWHYYDNSIRFDKIDRSTFWEKIEAVFDTECDIEKEAQHLKLQRIEKRAKELVAQATEDIDARANKMIDEEAKKRVTQNAVHTAVAKRLQEEKKQLESQRQQEKRQLEVQRQNETDQLNSKINELQTALAESRNGATWGWVLFGISVIVILIIAVNI